MLKIFCHIQKRGIWPGGSHQVGLSREARGLYSWTVGGSAHGLGGAELFRVKTEEIVAQARTLGIRQASHLSGFGMAAGYQEKSTAELTRRRGPDVLCGTIV